MKKGSPKTRPYDSITLTTAGGDVFELESGSINFDPATPKTALGTVRSLSGPPKLGTVSITIGSVVPRAQPPAPPPTPTPKRDVFKPPPWQEQLDDEEMALLDDGGNVTHRAPLDDTPPSVFAMEYLKPRSWVSPKGLRVAWSGSRPGIVPLDSLAVFVALYERDEQLAPALELLDWLEIERRLAGWWFATAAFHKDRGIVRIVVPVCGEEMTSSRPPDPRLTTRADARMMVSDFEGYLVHRLQPTIKADRVLLEPEVVGVGPEPIGLLRTREVVVHARCNVCRRDELRPDGFDTERIAADVQRAHLLCALQLTDPARYLRNTYANPFDLAGLTGPGLDRAAAAFGVSRGHGPPMRITPLPPELVAFSDEERKAFDKSLNLGVQPMLPRRPPKDR